MSAIKFIYFDLGNVLLNFSHQRMIDQVAAVAGISAALVQQHMFDNDLENRYETGELNSAQFHEEFCSLIKKKCVGLGILSNTCEAHWNFAMKRFPVLRQFLPVCVTSFEVKSMKPDAGIYKVAVEKAGVLPNEIFFTDDKPENIEAAQAAGFDAVQFSTANELLRDLSKRGVPV